MNHLSKCLYGILALVCFASCNKHADPTPTDDNGQEDTLLSKAIIWDSADLGATAYTREFLFDDQKRVKVQVRYNSDTNGVRLPGAVTDTTLQCFYNGAERNVYRSINGVLPPGSTYPGYLHFYNDDNQIIKDSLKNGNSYASRTYTWLPDKIIADDVEKVDILAVRYNTDYFTLLNNNIYAGVFGSAPNSGSVYDLFVLSYDSMINPLTKLNISSLMLVKGGQTFVKGTYLSPGYSKNNMIQRVSAFKRPDFQYAAYDKFQYTYNEFNLPVYCKISYSRNAAAAGRVKYVYTH